ncbi:unnamed protein product [Phytophthora lilii]|uniref:Unnamed protein product n=1 Tax=Phytophthora lilii TaxID=2077276 RepID=A0A9W6U0C9_9STRA|nr:unnamed protein product [Phytophthora lilii]
MPLTLCSRLYIRSSYKSIAAQALSKGEPNGHKYVGITGTPGIGKLVFVYYVMWRLAKDRQRTLFLTHKPPIYFDGSTMWVCNRLPHAYDRQFWRPDMWCLVDSADPIKIAGFPIHSCSVLLTTPLGRDRIGDFKKLAPPPTIFYMPLWSDEELASIAFLFPRATAVWKDRLSSLGGIPRLVLQDITTDPQDLLTSVCSSCSFEDCIMWISIFSDSNSTMNAVQYLVHMDSEEPYQEHKVAYASETAIKVIARMKGWLIRTQLENLVYACDVNPLAHSLCHYFFKSYALDLLEQGGIFEYRRLSLLSAETQQKILSSDSKYAKLIFRSHRNLGN